VNGSAGLMPRTFGFAAYPEAVDLAFGPYVRFGTIRKEYRNARMIYTPSEMVGTRRRGIRGISGRRQRTICSSHIERLNGTQRVSPCSTATARDGWWWLLRRSRQAL